MPNEKPTWRHSLQMWSEAAFVSLLLIIFISVVSYLALTIYRPIVPINTAIDFGQSVAFTLFWLPVILLIVATFSLFPTAPIGASALFVAHRGSGGPVHLVVGLLVGFAALVSCCLYDRFCPRLFEGAAMPGAALSLAPFAAALLIQGLVFAVASRSVRRRKR